MNNNTTCFSKSNFDTLTENQKNEYLKNNNFFCSSCHCVFNMYLIKVNIPYNKDKRYFSLLDCKTHNYRTYPMWYL